MTHARRHGLWCLVVLGTLGAGAGGAAGQDCAAYLSLYQQGASDLAVARLTGMSVTEAAFCRRVLSEPVYVGPAGAPPVNAPGRPPGPGAAGAPPGPNAAGVPPGGAAGPPPVGREMRRLP